MMKNCFTKQDTNIAKGLAIIIMYIHHFYLSPKRWTGYNIDFFPFSQDKSVLVASFFKVCVAIFVFLTGLGLMLSVKKKYPKLNADNSYMKKFVCKRLLSLISGCFFIYIFMAAFTIPSGLFRKAYGSGLLSVIYAGLDCIGVAHLFKTPMILGTWWYMSLAIVFVLIFPFLLEGYRKNRIVFISLIIVMPRALDLADTDLTRWLFSLILGMICADYNIFSALKEYRITNHKYIDECLKFIIALFMLYVFFKFWHSGIRKDFYDIIQGTTAFIIIYMSYSFISNIILLKYVLEFLGRHSMNMFLIHNYIRVKFFQNFSYGFENAWMNVLVLLCVTVILSIFLECLKRFIHYRDLIGYLNKKINERS